MMPLNTNGSRLPAYYIDQAGSRRPTRNIAWCPQTKVREFLEIYRTTEPNVYGHYASDEWIKHLMTFLGEDASHLVPEDIKIWMTTDQLFRDTNRKYRYNLSIEAYTFDGEINFSRFVPPPVAAASRFYRSLLLSPPGPGEDTPILRSYMSTTSRLYNYREPSTPVLDLTLTPTHSFETNASRSGNPNMNSTATGSMLSAGNQPNTSGELQEPADGMNNALMREQNGESNVRFHCHVKMCVLYKP